MRMSVPADLQAIQSDLSERTITLSLNIDPSGSIFLRSCEVIGKSFRNRISFQEQKSIEELLVGRLAQAVRRFVEDVPEGAHVLSVPEFLVELPGLALAGMHLMVMEARGGVRSAILRFREFMGAVNRAFKTEIGFHEPFPKHGEKLAVNILEDICLPILNLCRGLDTTELGASRVAARRLTNRAEEFEFQTELLKRYIYNAAMSHAELHDRQYYSLASPSPDSIAE